MRALTGTAGGALLSAITHGATIVLIGMLGTSLGGRAIGLLAALLTAIEPVSWLCGSRLWIDSMLAMLTTGAVVAALWALDAASSRRGFVAGLTLGVACLAKLSAVLVLPGIVAAALLAPRPVPLRPAIAYVAGAALCVVPWLVLIRLANGRWLPDSYPTAWQIAHYPYVAGTLERPAYFYVTGLLAIAPLFCYVPVALWRLGRERWLSIPLAWALGFAVPLTVLGVEGLGFQLRYMAPATPALCLIAAAGILSSGRCRWLPMALGVATFTSGLWERSPAGDPEPDAYYLERALAAARVDLRSLELRSWRAP